MEWFLGHDDTIRIVKIHGKIRLNRQYIQKILCQSPLKGREITRQRKLGRICCEIRSTSKYPGDILLKKYICDAIVFGPQYLGFRLLQ